MSITISDENVIITRRRLKTLSFEESKAINKSTGNNNSNIKLDFIPRLPLELITDIMKYFEPHVLIEMLSVSKEWENCILECPLLWSSWNINESYYDWNDARVLMALSRVGQHISELTLVYSTKLHHFIKGLFSHISDGTLCNLEILNLHGKLME